MRINIVYGRCSARAFKSALTTIMFTVVTLAALAAGSQATPNLINYQGRVTTPAGDPVPDGSYLIQLRIYDAATAGTVLWDNSYRTVALVKGLFSYQLGDSVAFPANLFTSGSQLWLGTKVGTDPEISPRAQLVSVPFSKDADHAGFADTAQLSLNEPGIAASQLVGQVTLTGATADILTVSITIPAPGYIVVDGRFYGYAGGTLGNNAGWVQIDTLAGGSYQLPYWTVFGSSSSGTLGYQYYPGSVYRVYYKSSAGTYSFRMKGAQASTSTGAAIGINYPMMRATYYPTSYGSVVTLATSKEVGQFEKSTEVPVGDVFGKPTGQTMYQVDLRELELKAAKAEAEVAQAQRKALEAQLQLERAKGEADKAGK